MKLPHDISQTSGTAHRGPFGTAGAHSSLVAALVTARMPQQKFQRLLWQFHFSLRAGAGVASGMLSVEASLNGALAAALAIPLQVAQLCKRTAEFGCVLLCMLLTYVDMDAGLSKLHSMLPEGA